MVTNGGGSVTDILPENTEAAEVCWMPQAQVAAEGFPFLQRINGC